MIERLALSAGNKKTISSDDVSDVLHEISSFETPLQIPLGFREDDSLDEFLARTSLGVYNHFRTVAGNTPKSHAFFAFIETPFTCVSSERDEYYEPVKRERGNPNLSFIAFSLTAHSCGSRE